MPKDTSHKGRPPQQARGAEKPQRHQPTAPTGKIVFGDNLAFLRTLPGESVDLIYIDPPFNTGRVQARKQLTTVRDEDAPDRVGFKGRGYRTQVLGEKSFDDAFTDFAAFIIPRLEEARRVLKPSGSFFLHIDYREVHYCKLYLDQIFGRASFINEIIWAYDYGARSRSRWSPKHDNILWYAKDPENYTFNFDEIDRIPYMAPGLVGPEKAARGKTPTDTWWHTIVSPTGKEKTGYPTQKPLGVVERIVRLHSNPGDTVLDFFAGSGTIGEACWRLGRNFILVDSNREAIDVMKRRLRNCQPEISTVSKHIPNNTQQFPPDRTDVHILAVSVWDYDSQQLENLQGPKEDLRMVKKLFASSSQLGLYKESQIKALSNPTIEELRASLVQYAMDRTATGDILIFYFSGHGTVLPSGEFGFCLKNTMARIDNGGCLPLTVLSFDDVVRTLTAADVHPVFIIDACFSGRAAPNDQTRVIQSMHDDIHRVAASSYGLLCACYAESRAIDAVDGGPFTRALYEVVLNGLADKDHLRKPFLQLQDLSGPIQRKLTTDNGPLPKLYVGPDFPEFPLVRNIGYKPLTETLMTYHKKTLDLMWDNGTPRTVTIEQIDDLGKSAYGNHSKLSLAPWLLVEDDGDRKHRRLTLRGQQFMQGKLKVAETLEKDVNGAWHPAVGSREISFSEIRDSNSNRRKD